MNAICYTIHAMAHIQTHSTKKQLPRLVETSDDTAEQEDVQGRIIRRISIDHSGLDQARVTHHVSKNIRGSLTTSTDEVISNPHISMKYMDRNLQSMMIHEGCFMMPLFLVRSVFANFVAPFLKRFPTEDTMQR